MKIDELRNMAHVNVENIGDKCAKVATESGYWLTDGEGYTTEVYCPTSAELPDYEVVGDKDKRKAENAARYEGKTLDEAKAMLIADIAAYNESDAVNGFAVNGIRLWFDPDMRGRIEKGVRNSQTLGRENYEAWLDALGVKVSIPCATALQMLARIEVYALDCLNVTSEHKAEAGKLESVDEVAAYDYTAGYPEMLSFTF